MKPIYWSQQSKKKVITSIDVGHKRTRTWSSLGVTRRGPRCRRSRRKRRNLGDPRAWSKAVGSKPGLLLSLKHEAGGRICAGGGGSDARVFDKAKSTKLSHRKYQETASLQKNAHCFKTDLSDHHVSGKLHQNGDHLFAEWSSLLNSFVANLETAHGFLCIG